MKKKKIFQKICGLVLDSSYEFPKRDERNLKVQIKWTFEFHYSKIPNGVFCFMTFISFPTLDELGKFVHQNPEKLLLKTVMVGRKFKFVLGPLK